MLHQNKLDLTALTDTQELKAINEKNLRVFLSLYDFSEEEECRAKLAITTAIRAILQHRGG